MILNNRQRAKPKETDLPSTVIEHYAILAWRGVQEFRDTYFDSLVNLSNLPSLYKQSLPKKYYPFPINNIHTSQVPCLLSFETNTSNPKF
jgi:hypothetical protein